MDSSKIFPRPRETFWFVNKYFFFFETFLARLMNSEHSDCFVGFYIRHEHFLPFSPSQMNRWGNDALSGKAGISITS